MGLIPNDWKHLLRNETYEKSLFKISATTIKLLGKEKTSKKLSNKEIYFTLQSNSAKIEQTFQIHFMAQHILSSDIWGKTFSDWFKKCSDG